MKRIVSVLTAAALAVLAFCSCGDLVLGEDLTVKVKPDENAAYNFKNFETAPPPAYSNYKTSAMNFSFNMLNSLDGGSFSPMALYYQLSLLQNAASSATQNSIKNLTSEGLSLEDLNACNAYFFSRLDNLSKPEKGRYIDITGDFFLNEKTPYSQSFLLSNADYYNQGIFRLDYSSESFLDQVNAYLGEKTSNRSKYSKTPDKKSGMLLVNSAFMKDSWLNGYREKDVVSVTFKGNKNNRKTSFLKSTEFYLKGKNCEGIVKDFKTTPAKFVAIIPKGNNLNEFMNKFTGDEYFELIGSMKPDKTCTSYIPEFSQGENLSFINNKNLKFLSEQGNYSGLSYNAKSSVFDISQSYKFRISRSGIDADKTYFSNSSKAAPSKTVKLNRPFIYMVVDNESMLPIFMGAITDIK